MSLLIDLAAGYRGRVVVEVRAEVPAGVTAVVGPNELIFLTPRLVNIEELITQAE